MKKGDKKRKMNALRKRRVLVVDMETCSLAPDPLLYRASPILPHIDPQVEKILASLNPPADYKPAPYDMMFYPAMSGKTFIELM